VKRELASSLLLGAASDLNVPAPDIPEGFFTGGNEDNEGQIFSLKTIPWLPSFPSVGLNPEGRSRWFASQSFALHDEAINCRSSLLSFFRHPRIELMGTAR
jgi:hypothetical protein